MLPMESYLKLTVLLLFILNGFCFQKKLIERSYVKAFSTTLPDPDKDIRNQFLFDESIPVDARKLMLRTLDSEKELKTVTLKLDLDNKLLMEKLEHKLETQKLLDKISVLTTGFQKSQTTLAAFNVRALIEFVENFKIPKLEGKKLSRQDRWAVFLKSDTQGMALYECITEANPMWKSEVEVANKIKEIYSTSSDAVHSTAHELNAGGNVVIERLTHRLQEFNLAVCIANAYCIVWTKLDEA